MDEKAENRADDTQSPSFEEALKRLETIVSEMESGRQSLETSLKTFEEGMGLAKLCADRLAETEKRIEVLVKRADKSLGWETVDADALGGPAETGDDAQ